MELISLVYDDAGRIVDIEELTCAICGGDHHAEDCPNAWD